MQFLNPAAFYLLGVIPIVVLLHFLRLRPQQPAPRPQYYVLAFHR